MDYDCDILIVGAGLAGLYCARELLKHNPNQSVVVCEKYKKVGGRAVTFHKDGHQWEIGAGRISDSHKMVLGLIKEYGLHTVPIQSGLNYRENGLTEYEENHFEPAIDIFLGPLQMLPHSVLGTHTLKEVMLGVYGPSKTQRWMDRFPYHAEVVVMRADMALREFFSEMKSHEGYFVCKEGLSALMEAMAADIQERGGVVHTEYELIDVSKGLAEFYSGSTSAVADAKASRGKDKSARPKTTISAKKIVLALHASALRALPSLRGWAPLKHVTMSPLLRIYAVFPGKAWFKGLTRIVTTSPIRYFLPMSEESGTAMISYTDNVFAKHFMKMDTELMEKEVMKDLRELFPEREIPDPTFFKAHPWTDGVSYWLPGNYKPAQVSVEALKPGPGIYVCGESFSLRQGWMEGALEHAALLLRTHFR
jgi:hypothetical protein